MNNKYVFVADSDGNRKATYLLNIGENEAEALARVQAEYPDCTCFIGDDDHDYKEFVAENKLYIDGHYVERPPYVPTQEEINAGKIAELKAELASTDYKCLKYVDGAISESEYAEIKAYRAELRRKINELEG